MNIKQAKDEIKNAMSAYFSQDEFGNYAVSIEKQRPVFLVGAPGIGKTAIMEQIAHEIGVGLISYSMTHHTRDTMLGLPFASKKHFGESTYDVSEYTMSEIISSIYEYMEDTNIKEGMLLIDEINCVSDSLAPVLLQFLQYKVFGKHRVPDGWIIVSAGNPPEYNDSVTEFDIAILDRLRRFEVSEDYPVWREFALNSRVHPAVLSYLDIKSGNFYCVGKEGDVKNVITARSWDDLSIMLGLYENQKLPIDIILIKQYLQHSEISVEFTKFYELFNKCVVFYQPEKILEGKFSDEVMSRAKAVEVSERTMLINMLLDSVFAKTGDVVSEQNVMKRVVTFLRSVREKLLNDEVKAVDVLNLEIFAIENRLNVASMYGNLSKKKTRVLQGVMKILNVQVLQLYSTGVYGGTESYDIIKTDYDSRLQGMLRNIVNAKSGLENMLLFTETVFGGAETLEYMQLIITSLKRNSACLQFVDKHSGDDTKKKLGL